MTGLANVHIDTTEINAWDSITEFMKSIRKNDLVVLLISDEYLKSVNCMYEVVQLMQDEYWNNKTMSFVVKDEEEIYNTISHADYIKYWEGECNDLERRVSKLPPASISELCNELKKSETIRNNIGKFLKMVADRKNPSKDQLISEIKKRLKTIAVSNDPDDVELIQPIVTTMVKESLSKEAIKLLICACEDKDGAIIKTQTLSGLSIIIRNRDFVSVHERREEARWESAIKELQSSDLIEATNYKNEIFLVTNSGFIAADRIKAKFGSHYCDCPKCKYSGPAKYANVCPICGFTSDDG